MTKSTYSVPVLLLLGCAFLAAQTNSVIPPAAAQSQRHARTDYEAKLLAFEDFVREQMKSDNTVGMTIGFFKDDFTWVKAFGYADLENRIPMKAESAYRLASITKPMTAIAVLQLVEHGKINLDDEIQKYVPDFPKKKYPITVRQLLGHLGGVRHSSGRAEILMKERKNTRETIAIFADSDLVAEPDTKFSYSSFGYVLLAAAIEKVSGKSYADYMRENVWGPLKMNDTRVDDPFDLIPNRVRGYQFIKDQVKNSEYIDISNRLGSGNARSTVGDLLKFARGVIAGKLLSPEMRDRMWTPMTTTNGRFTTYGMGWLTDSSNGRFVVWHGGYIMETQAALLVFPHLNFAIAALMNFEGATPYSYTDKLFKIILDEPWRVSVYTKLENDRITLRAMDEAFNYGMRYFKKKKKPLTSDTKELAEAFAYFNSIPALPVKDAADRVSNGRHPQANQAFVKMASFMATKLRGNNPRGFDNYFRSGPIPLFADYIRLYKTDQNFPAELKFTEAFGKQVDQWNRDWTRTWTDETRVLEFTANSDLEKVGRLLRTAFKGATLYPNFQPRLESLTDSLVARGDAARALEAAKLAVDVYPDSTAANIELGMVYSLARDKVNALAAFRRAKELDPAETSPNTLNRFAYFLVDKDHVQAGIHLLEAAVELYPREANLYDSIGELYAKLGQKEKAAEFYTKALEVNPNYANAANARELLKKLRQE